MINFLRCFPSLRKLYYDHTGPTVGYANVLPQKLGAAIAHLQDSLEELTLLDIGFEEIRGDELFYRLGLWQHSGSCDALEQKPGSCSTPRKLN